MSLFFGPLPPAIKVRTDWYSIAAELRARPANPDEWALVKVCKTRPAAGNVATRIRTGATAAFLPAGAFDAQNRLVRGEHQVFARYVGEVTK